MVVITTRITTCFPRRGILRDRDGRLQPSSTALAASRGLGPSPPSPPDAESERGLTTFFSRPPRPPRPGAYLKCCFDVWLWRSGRGAGFPRSDPPCPCPHVNIKLYIFARRKSERTLLEATFAITSSGRARDPRPARRISASSPPAAADVHAAASTETFAPWVAVARRRAFGHGAERG